MGSEMCIRDRLFIWQSGRDSDRLVDETAEFPKSSVVLDWHVSSVEVLIVGDADSWVVKP